MSTFDIVVVGGGIIGLSIAFTLSGEGASVLLLDSAEEGQASKASAGMLAPLGESRESSPFVPLAVEALKRWPSFIETVEAVGGTNLKINGPGMLRIALDEEEEDELHRTFKWQQSHGLPLQMLGPSDLVALEPGLTPEVHAAILTPMELYVEPQTILEALRAACSNQGVAFQHTTAKSFSIKGRDINGILTDNETVTGSQYVVAGGAWSRPLLCEIGYDLPVHPVRGQIVAYAPMTPSPLRYTIYSHRGYLVPRPDGRILAGATEERVGFNYSNTTEGVSGLNKMAASLVSRFAGYNDYTTWAGLRPISDDKMALIGHVPGYDNLWMATGHGRNGVLLAPYTGSLMADALLHGRCIPTVFDPLRFNHTS